MAASVINATASASSVIHMCDPALLSKYAMSAISEASKEDALSAAAKAFQMLTTAKNAHKWRKTETGALK